MLINNKKLLSPHVAQKLPDYILKDYSVFVFFFEKFYEYLEQENKLVDALVSLEKNHDVDRALNQFIEHFENIYLNKFSKKIYSSVDKTNIIKNSKSFYRSKGSIKAYKFLFKLLFNDDISIYLPSEDILKLSDGKWEVLQYMYCDGSFDVSSIIGRRITQGSSSALVENASYINYNNTVYGQLTVSSVIGSFDPLQPISVLNQTVAIYGIVSDVSVTDGGESFSVNDKITFKQNSLETIVNVKTVVGEVSDVKLVNSGFGYQKPPKISIFGSGSGAKFRTYLTPIGVQRIDVLDGGFGYSSILPPAVEFQVIPGTVSPVCEVIVENGSIKQINILSSGDGYYEIPTITLNDSANGNNGSGFLGDVFLLPTSIDRIEVLDGGKNYNTNIAPQVTVDSTYIYETLNSENAIVDVVISGRITNFDYEQIAIGFNPNLPVSISYSNATGINASFNYNIGSIFIENGQFISSDGFLSSNKYIQDNFFYQLFSYVINTTQSYADYSEIVKSTIHPAGMLMFGNVRYKNFGILGPTNQTFDRAKFYNKPHENFIYEFPDANQDYYDAPFFETVEQFRNITSENITLNRKNKSNYVHAPYIKIYSPTTGIPFDALAEYNFILGTNSQVLYDIRQPFYNGILGSSTSVDVYDPTWNVTGLQFNNSIVDCRSIPNAGSSQSIIVVFSPSTINRPCSLIGSIDSNGQTSGYAIGLNLDRSIHFTAQKNCVDTNMYFNVVSYPENSIVNENWYVACLRYNHNTLTLDGMLNLQTPVSSVFADDVETIGVINNSSGYILGLQGYNPLFLPQNNIFGEVTFDNSLFDTNSTEFTNQGSFDENVFDSQIFGDSASNFSFNGNMAYSIIYDRYITNLEYQGIYAALKEILPTRGITLP